MKKWILVIAILLTNPTLHAEETSKEEVGQKTKEAVQAAANYTKEQKDQIQKDLEGSFTAVKKRISELKAKADTKTGEAKKKAKAEVAELEKKQKEIGKELKKLKKSSGKAWDEMKSGMQQAIEKLSEAYDKAKDSFE